MAVVKTLSSTLRLQEKNGNGSMNVLCKTSGNETSVLYPSSVYVLTLMYTFGLFFSSLLNVCHSFPLAVPKWNTKD